MSQANAIAHHELTLPAREYDPFFRPFLSGVRDDRVVFKYQPEWPALIAASNGLFGSTLPLRVLMAIAGVFAGIAWLAWELTRDRAGGVLGAAACSSRRRSHGCRPRRCSATSCRSCSAPAAAAALRPRRPARRRRATGSRRVRCSASRSSTGRSTRCSRPCRCSCTGAGGARRRARRACSVARSSRSSLGGLPFAVVFSAYNRSVMGGVTRLAYNVTGPADTFGFGWRASFEAPGGGHAGQIDYTVGRAFSTLGHSVRRAAARSSRSRRPSPCSWRVCVWSRRRDARAWLLVAMVAVVVVGYFFWWGVANSYAFGLDRSLGPFYYYPLLAPLCVLAAWGAVSVPGSRASRRDARRGRCRVGWRRVDDGAARRARDAGKGRSAEVHALEAPAPAPSLVLEAPQFPNDPYLRVATDARCAARVSSRSTFPVGASSSSTGFPAARRIWCARTDASATRSAPSSTTVSRCAWCGGVTSQSASTCHSVTAGWGGCSCRSATTRRELVAGRAAVGRIDTEVRLRASDIPRDGSVVPVAVGVTIAPPGATTLTSRTGNWFDARTEARVTPDGRVEILDLCDGRHHYEFPNDVQATITEDVAPELGITFTAAD